MKRILSTAVCYLWLITSSLAEYDVRWVELTNFTYKPKQVPAVAYDAEYDRIVMLGGGYTVDDSVYLSNELLQFSLTSGWSPIIPYYSLGASCLWDINSCFDPIMRRTVFAGGTFPESGKTWVLTGNELTHLCDSEVLLGNSGCGLFFNNEINRVCLIGRDGQIYKLEGNLWLSLAVTLPNWESRHVFGYSFNPVQKNLLVFGGRAVDGTGKEIQLSDTFLWNAHTKTWKKVVNASHPGERWHPAMCFDPVRQKHIMFGGGTFIDGGGVRTWRMNADVWEYNDETEQWNELEVENPHGQDMHRLVYAEDQNKILSIAGSNDAHGWAYSTTAYELQYIPKSAAKSWGTYGEK